MLNKNACRNTESRKWVNYVNMKNSLYLVHFNNSMIFFILKNEAYYHKNK